MSNLLANRVLETTNTNGTGTVNLNGPVTGFQDFVAGIGSGNQCYYCITNDDDWEIGIGTVTSGGTDTLSRDTLINSSTAGFINWTGGGTKNVFVTPPADLFLAKNVLSLKTASYNVTLADDGAIIPASAAGGTFPINLPAITTVPDGFTVTVFRSQASTGGTNYVNIVTNAADTSRTIARSNILFRLLSTSDCVTVMKLPSATTPGSVWTVTSTYRYPTASMVIAKQASVQSVAPSTTTRMNFTNIIASSSDNSAGSNDRLSVSNWHCERPQGGFYQVSACIELASLPAGKNMWLDVWLNSVSLLFSGGRIPGDGSASVRATLSGMFYLDDTDDITIRLTHNHTSNLSTVNAGSYLSIHAIPYAGGDGAGVGGADGGFGGHIPS
jgi:hypothetical protein